MPSDYARVVANLWFTDAQGMQFGVMGPSWLHGRLGPPFPLQPPPLDRKPRHVLFALR